MGVNALVYFLPNSLWVHFFLIFLGAQHTYSGEPISEEVDNTCNAGACETSRLKNDDCLSEHWEDMDTPVEDIVAARQDGDAYCHFGWIGTWLSQCTVAARSHNYSNFALFLRRVYLYRLPFGANSSTIISARSARGAGSCSFRALGCHSV